jgi:hypothetical protein
MVSPPEVPRNAERAQVKAAPQKGVSQKSAAKGIIKAAPRRGIQKSAAKDSMKAGAP